MLWGDKYSELVGNGGKRTSINQWCAQAAACKHGWSEGELRGLFLLVDFLGLQYPRLVQAQTMFNRSSLPRPL